MLQRLLEIRSMQDVLGNWHHISQTVTRLSIAVSIIGLPLHD